MKGERLLLVASCVLATALIAGCGSGSATSTHSSAAPVAATQTTTPQDAAEAKRAREEAVYSNPRLLERSFAPNPYPEPGPTPAHPGGSVRRLSIHDVKRGRGLPAQADDIVYADFVKTYYRSGRKFLTAWGPHRTAYLALASEALAIRRGIAGMRPGGRRTIVMPGRIDDVHSPTEEGWEAAIMQVVLRRVRHLPTP